MHNSSTVPSELASWVFDCQPAQRGVTSALRNSCQLPALCKCWAQGIGEVWPGTRTCDTSVQNGTRCLLPAGLYSQMGQTQQQLGERNKNPIYWVRFIYWCRGIPAQIIKSSKQDSQPLSSGNSSTHCSGTCSSVSSWVMRGSSHDLCSVFIIQLVMATCDQPSTHTTFLWISLNCIQNTT